MTREEVIEKVQKLLNHAEGAKRISSLEEADTATLKANKLIEDFNIEQYELHKSEKLIIGEILLRKEDIGYEKREGPWLNILLNMIALNNFCICINFNSMDSFKIFGTKDNCALVSFLFDQVKNQFKSLEKQRWSEYDGEEKRGSFRRGYLSGAVHGLGVKLRKEKEKALSTDGSLLPAVIKSHKDEIDRYIRDNVGKLKQGKPVKIPSRESNVIGFKDGINTNLNKGLGTKQTEDIYGKN